MASLASLDEALQRVALALAKSTTPGHWRSLELRARYAPDASVSRHEFVLVRPDGSVDEGFLPGASARAAVYAATRDHWDISRQLGPSAWFVMTVHLTAEGQVRADFQYSDHYVPGDVVRG